MAKYRKRRPTYKKWITTFTKAAVVIIIGVCLLDLQLSYILAFLGRDQIAESLSSTIADTVIGVTISYFLKALLETFFEKREERLTKTKTAIPSETVDPDPEIFEPEEIPEDEVAG